MAEKTMKTKRNAKIWAALLLLGILILLPASHGVFCLPEPDAVVNGQADFVCPTPTSMQINASDKAIVNFKSFNIKENESVIINLPTVNSEILNRVVGNKASDILGNLSCNGVMILVNKNGIFIGPNAQVNVGSLIASTRDITNSNFVDSKYIFEKVSEEQLDMLLVNQGTIRVSKGGFGVLIAGAVENEGTIICPMGTIALVGGDMITLNIADSGLISVAIDKATASTIYDRDGQPVTSQIKNTGYLEADGGVVLLKAESVTGIFEKAINLEGTIRAQHADGSSGTVRLDTHGKVMVNAIIAATNIKIGEAKVMVPVEIRIPEIVLQAEESIELAAEEIYATVEAPKTEIYKTGNIEITDVHATAQTITIEGEGFQVTYLQATDLTLHTDNAVNTTPGIIIQANQIRVIAKQFGTPTAPLHILADKIYITRVAGFFDILQFEGIGTSIMLRGPPDGFGAIIYNNIASLELNAEKVRVIGNEPLYLYSNITFHNFECTTPGKEIYFESGKTYTFKGFTYIYGQPGGENIVYLRSSEKGTPWYIDVQSEEYIFSMVGIGDSYNIGQTVLRGHPSSTFGNNSRWNLNTVVWTGAVSALWSVSGNWNGGTPAGQAVEFTSGSVVSTIDTAYTGANALLSLTINGYTGTITQSANLAITGDYVQSTGNFISNPSYTFTVGGNFSIPYAGGTFNRFTGNGGSGNPYLIYDVYGLQAVTCYLTSYFTLYNNIDASPTKHWNWTSANGGYYQGFFPIGDKLSGSYDTFNGYRNDVVFEGNQKAVFDLYINRPDLSHVGLFGYVCRAIIQNLGVVNADITGGLTDPIPDIGTAAGIIVGTMWNYQRWYSLTIMNCFSSGTIHGTDNVGGIVGGSYDASFDNNFSEADVYGRSYVGGIIGGLGNGQIYRCASTGNVTATVDYAGGIMGSGGGADWHEPSWCYVSSCFSTATVTSPGTYVGGLAGLINNGTVGPLYPHSYYTDTSHQNGMGTYEPAGPTAFYGNTHDVYTGTSNNGRAWDFVNTYVSSPTDIARFTFYVPPSIDITGTVDGLTSGVSIKLIIDGLLYDTKTSGIGGAYSFLDVDLANRGKNFLIFADSNNAYKINILGKVTKIDSSASLGEILLAGDLTNANLVTAWYNDINGTNDIYYTASGNSATFAAGMTLKIASGVTYTPDGTTQVNGILANQGKIKLIGTESISVAAAVDSGTVEYYGSSSYTGLVGGNSYHNLIFNGSGAYTLNQPLLVTTDLTISAGTVNAPTSITIGGNFSRATAATFNHNNGTITFNAATTGKTITTNGSSLANVTINGIGGGWTLQDDLTVTNTFTLSNGTLSTNDKKLILGAYTQNGGTFNAGSLSITCKGNFGISSPAIFNAGTSTLILDASNATSGISFNAGGYTFNKISLNNTSSSDRTITIGTGNYIFNGNFYLVSLGTGRLTVDATANNPNITILGNFGVGSSATPQDVDATQYTYVGGNSSYEWIQRVQFNGIDLTSGNNGGYLDATNNITNALEPTQTYTISITSTASYTEYFSVWFDWNQDHALDESERYNIGSAYQTVVSTDILVPGTATAGSTLFRVNGEYGGWPSSAYSHYWNETEDYSAFVSSGTGSGDGPKTINAGNGTWRIDGNVDMTGVTFNPGQAKRLFTTATPNTALPNPAPFIGLALAGTDSGTWNLTGALDLNAGLDIYAGTSLTQNSYNITVRGNTTINPSTFTYGSGTLYLLSDLTLNAGGNNLGRVVIGSSPDRTDLANNFECNYLTINAADSFYTHGYNVLIHNDLTITSGLLDATRESTRTTTITLSGNWTNNGGNFVADNSTVIFNSNSIIGGSTATTFNNVTVTGTVDQTRSMIVNGDFAINSGFFNCSNPATYTFTVNGDFALNGGTFDRWTGGGTVGDPYMIYDVYGLQAMKQILTAWYTLYQDINASPTQNWSGGFEPVGNDFPAAFSGNFNGSSHTITSLTINRSGESNVGLFGATQGASISNIGLIALSISGNSVVGGLVGSNSSSSISTSYATGTVNSYAQAGGLVGENSNSSIINSYANVNVTSTGPYDNWTGGLVGNNYASAISNSYAAGRINGAGTGLGGLAGRNADSNISKTISNSFATGEVVGGSNRGGLVGIDSYGICTNCWYIENGATQGIGNIPDPVPANGTITKEPNGAKAFTQTMTFSGNMVGAHKVYWQNGVVSGTPAWNFTNSGDGGHTDRWIMTGLPHLQIEYSTNITNVYQLQMMALNLNANYTLANNIVATETSTWNWDGSGTLPTDYYGFEPVGNDVTNFNGYLYGQGYKITGLTINRPATSFVGLFGWARNGVNNLGLENVSITGYDYVGGLIGYTVHGWNVTDNVYVTGTITGHSCVGGLLGGLVYTTIKNSYFEGSIVAVDTYGGLYGYSHWFWMYNSHYDIDNVSFNGTTGTYVADGGIYQDLYAAWKPTKSLNINTYLPSAGGYYELRDITDLKELLGFVSVEGAGYKFKLAFDADLSLAPTNYHIPYIYAAEFDGNNKLITNVNINMPTKMNQGFFGYVTYLTIKNVRLESGSVSGSHITGGLVGFNQGDPVGTITDSYSRVNVTAYSTEAGAFIGMNQGNGEIRRCYATGNLTMMPGSLDGGGFVGKNIAKIYDSYATGNVSAPGGTNIGGFVGNNQEGYIIDNCYSTGNVTGGASVGGFAGYNGGAISTITDSVWNTTTSGQAAGVGAGNTSGVYGKNAQQMMDIATFTGLSWSVGSTLGSTWAMSGDNNAYPLLQMRYSTSITDVYQLQLMYLDLDATYTLANNINASETSTWNYDGTRYLGFAPVGSDTGAYENPPGTWNYPNAFIGSLNGQHYTITGLYINRPYTDSVGLFGEIRGGSGISNIGIESAGITGQNYVGIFAGWLGGWTSITSCYSTGPVSGNDQVGGLVGGDQAYFYTCYSTATVSSTYGSGGLVSAHWSGIIKDSYFAGTATTLYTTTGGIFGWSNGGILINTHYNIDTVHINGNHYASAGGLYNSQYLDWFPAKFLSIANYASSLPYNGSSTYYEISTAQGLKDLLGFTDFLDVVPSAKFRITANIDLSAAPANFYIPYLRVSEFDGNNKAITNLNITLPCLQNFGFIGISIGTTIKNLNISGSVNGYFMGGGLVGVLYGSSLTNSHFSGSVSGASVGGAVGRSFSNTIISDSYSTGTVSGSDRNGGFISSASGDIDRCYSTATVSGGWAGGFAGSTRWEFASITDCYATGNVTADRAGGFIGGPADGGTGTMTNCYSTGAVNGTSYKGGFTGYDNYIFTYTSCYWNQTLNPTLLDTGDLGNISGAGRDITGKTTQEMKQQSTYNGWNFTVTSLGAGNGGGIWIMAGYPHLQVAEWSQTITNVYQLQMVRLNVSTTYTLANNINASETKTWDWNGSSYLGFYPIGNDGSIPPASTAVFSGTFNGAGHIITDLTVNRPGVGMVGLFGASTGTVSDVGLLNVNITGGDYTGALVGFNAKIIFNCYVAGGSVTGGGYTGGLVGLHYRYYGTTTTTITDCYAAVRVSGTGGLVGYLLDASVPTNSYYDQAVSGQSDTDKGTPMTTAQMMQQGTFNPPWNFTTTWAIEQGKSYPYLRGGYPSGAQAISGYVYSNQGTIPIGSNVTVALAINGSIINTTPTAANSMYYFLLDGAQLNNFDKVLVYIDEHTTDGNTITVAADSSITGLDIYGSTLIVRYETGSFITNDNLGTAKGSLNDADILYSVASSNLTLGASLYIPTSYTFTPSGNIALSGNWTNYGTFTPSTSTVNFTGNTTVSGSATHSFTNVQITGTLTGYTGNMNVAGNWTNNGTFNAGTGTVSFGGTSAILGTNITTFNNVTITGTLTGHSTNMNVIGNWDNNGVFTSGAGTVTFNGTGAHTIKSGNSAFNNITFNNAGGTWALQDMLNASGNLTITTGNLDVSASSYGIILAGNWANSGT
ncbi:MAG: filamentous hemagglutinin N-terminal domain-containing protein, partial [Candidatus Omnitrophica bacterium]|nr:filamentous hemagglutinin N-terminal domain-containing protein [Candidatus Omnitrophota bacterium]